MEKSKKIKKMFGKLLGEIYKLQYYNENIVSKPNEASIYGLLNGIESAIDIELDKIDFVSKEKFEDMIKILDEYYYDDKKLKEFNGYRDIELSLEEKKISRTDAMRILKYLYSDGRYVELIEKMDNDKSPLECRKFDLSKWDI